MKLNKILLTIISAYIAFISLIYFILFFRATFSYYRNPPQILLIEMFLLLLVAAFMFMFLATYYSKDTYQNYSPALFSAGIIISGGVLILFPQSISEIPPRHGLILNQVSNTVEFFSVSLLIGVIAVYFGIGMKDLVKRHQKPNTKKQKDTSEIKRPSGIEIIEIPPEPDPKDQISDEKSKAEIEKLEKSGKSLLSSFSSSIDTFMKKLSEKADETSRRRKFKKFERNLKFALLDRFSMSQLEGICRARGISLQVEGKRGKRRARSKEELIPKLLDLSFDELIKIAKRHGIRYDDLLRELEEARKNLLEKKQIDGTEQEIPFEGSILDEVLSIIQAEFKPEVIRDEEDLEKQLTIFLKLKLGEERVIRQGYRGGKRVDILIDGYYGLELKLADSNQSLASLPTQLKLYSRRLEDVAAVIAIPGNVEIDEEILDILDEEGFKYIVINAEITRK